MNIKEIKIKVDQNIIWYCTGIINIENLVDFVKKIDSKDVGMFLKSSKDKEMGYIIDLIQDYNSYKEDGYENIFIERITNYYKKELIHV